METVTPRGTVYAAPIEDPESCDSVTYGKAESLNAAVACAILAYESRKQGRNYDL